MRIAHCIHGLGVGGAQQVVREITAGSDRSEFRYFVYCCVDGDTRPRIEETGATVRVLPRRLSKIDPAWVRGLARAMREDHVDLVHTHLFGDSLHGYLAARASGR